MDRTGEEMGYYGTGRRPRQPGSRITVLLAVAVLIVVGNLVAVVVLRERMGGGDPGGATFPSGLSDVLAGDPVETVDEPAQETAFDVDDTPRVEISHAQIYRKIGESLVTIESGTRTGLGVIFRADGYVLANASVIEEEWILLRLRDGTEYVAECLGIDEASDLAVLRIDAQNLRAAEFADDSALSQENTLLTFALSESGQIQMYPVVFCDTAEVSLSGQSLSLLQFDTDPAAAVGPLVNGAGQIVGFTVSAVGSYVSFGSARRLAYALPSEDLGAIASELLEFGCVRERVWLGVRVCELDEALRRYWQLPEGVLIEEIEEGSNAALAGIEPGDVIVRVGGLTVRELSDYREALNRCTVGETIYITIYRRGAQYSARLVLRGQGQNAAKR